MRMGGWMKTIPKDIFIWMFSDDSRAGVISFTGAVSKSKRRRIVNQLGKQRIHTNQVDISSEYRSQERDVGLKLTDRLLAPGVLVRVPRVFFPFLRRYVLV